MTDLLSCTWSIGFFRYEIKLVACNDETELYFEFVWELLMRIKILVRYMLFVLYYLHKILVEIKNGRIKLWYHDW